MCLMPVVALIFKSSCAASQGIRQYEWNGQSINLSSILSHIDRSHARPRSLYYLYSFITVGFWVQTRITEILKEKCEFEWHAGS